MNTSNKNNGFALPIVMFFLVVLLSITYAAFNMSVADIEKTDNNIKKEDAIYYAEAGFNRYLYFLNENPKFYNTQDSTDMENAESISFKDGFYKLNITAPTFDNPYLKIRSTGWVAGKYNKSRTIEVRIRRRQFTNFVYGTESEKMPNNDEIWWTSSDTVNGPLHTNGTLNITGSPVFKGEVTYSTGLNDSTAVNPVYEKGAPYKSDYLVFPENNDDLKDWADEDSGGYTFEGRTCILLEGDQMKIRVKDGSIETKEIPDSGVIYVNKVVESATSKFGLNSGNVFISGELDGQLTVVAEDSIFITGYDPTNWNRPGWNNYYFSSSHEYTGGITYENQTFDENNDDMLGLIANRNIELLHYGWPTGGGYTHWSESYNDSSIYNMKINAALFTLNGSFSYEYHNYGGVKGNLEITGSIFQNSRGPVGTFNTNYGTKLTGYDKVYNHDTRMLYDTPPHFLEPENSGWEIINWQEIY